MTKDDDRKIAPRRFHSWILPNIIAFLLCFPIGIVGLVFSVKALRAFRRGDLALSKYHAESARAYFWFATLLGVPFGFFCLLQAWFASGAP
ncbi:MAG: CD225/dispanin family protein [Thermoguttaceae bacterium]|jgi:uncharacterized membrane protein